MAKPSTEETSLSIKEIVITIIIDTSSPISSWLVNVIGTYLGNTQSLEPLTTDVLFTLTNDMLLTYSIATTQTQCKQICSRLISLLQTNQHIPEFDEPFPIHTQCIAFYTNDKQWYPATIIDITQPGHTYLIQFDGYGDTNHTVTIDQIQNTPSEKEDAIQAVS
eukprot:393100_1